MELSLFELLYEAFGGANADLYSPLWQGFWHEFSNFFALFFAIIPFGLILKFVRRFNR